MLGNMLSKLGNNSADMIIGLGKKPISNDFLEKMKEIKEKPENRNKAIFWGGGLECPPCILRKQLNIEGRREIA